MSNSTTSRRMQSHARTSRESKQTHKLTPQTCVVWVPGFPGYMADYGPGVLRVASRPEFAYHLTEDKAEDLAMALRLHLGIRATIRPYYSQAKG